MELEPCFKPTVFCARVECRSLFYSRHAIERMLERRIESTEVRAVIDTGEVIEGDPTDRPYPSYLILGIASARPIHVVLGYDASETAGIVVTVYVPDPAFWRNDWKTRKQR